MRSFAGPNLGRVTRLGLLVVLVAACAALARLVTEATDLGSWTPDPSLSLVSADPDRQSGQPSFRPTRVVDERPPIVNAPVVHARKVGDEVTDTELVLGVVVNGAARAYPINMLTGPAREIINDSLGGKAIAATW